jgi:hypothetical protein
MNDGQMDGSKTWEGQSFEVSVFSEVRKGGVAKSKLGEERPGCKEQTVFLNFLSYYT